MQLDHLGAVPPPQDEKMPTAGIGYILRRSSKIKCKCDLCKRGRRYYRNTAKLPKAERDWMRGFYDSVMDAECEAEMGKAVEGNDSRATKG